MSTQLFLTDHDCDVSPRLTNPKARLARTKRGSSSVNYVTSTVAGPTAGVQVNSGSPNVVTWFTPPFDAVTISGTVTFNIRGLESAMNANVGFDVLIERCRPNGTVVSTIVRSERGVELGTADAAQNWTATPTSTTLAKGDRIKITVFGNDVGTMGSGFSFTMSLHGPTAAAAGDTYVTFTEDLTILPLYLFMSGLESGNEAEIATSPVGGIMAAETTIKRTGSYALHVDCVASGPGTSNLSPQWENGTLKIFNSSGFGGPDVNNLFFTFWIWIVARPTAQKVIANCQAQGNAIIQLTIDASGVALCRYVDSGSAFQTIGSTPTLNNGQWYRIDLAVDDSNVAGGIDREWFLDGVSQGSVQNGTWQSAANTMSQATIEQPNDTSLEFWVDDLVLSLYARPPDDYGVRAMVPDGAGNYTAWTGTFADVDEIPPDDDTSYITDSTAGDREAVTLASAAASSIGSNIVAVMPYARVRDEAGTPTVKAFARSGSTDYDPNVAVDIGATYAAMFARPMTQDPATNAAWTTGGLDGAEVGVHHAAVASALRATQLLMMVWSDAGVSLTPAQLAGLWQDELSDQIAE